MFGGRVVDGVVEDVDIVFCILVVVAVDVDEKTWSLLMCCGDSFLVTIADFTTYIFNNISLRIRSRSRPRRSERHFALPLVLLISLVLQTT